MSNNNLKKISRGPTGIINIPPSKSISHRAVICAALAGNKLDNFGINNLGESEDIAATSSAIKQILEGNNNTPIDCGESGSTLRFLIPIAAMNGKEWHFIGKGRLMERPQTIYEDIFIEKNIRFEKGLDGIKIQGPLKGGEYHLPGDVSSQFVSGLLFALSLANQDSEIKLTTPLESKDYVELTIDVMHEFGVEVIKRTDDIGNVIGYSIAGGQKYLDVSFTVEGDYSQAAFFLCAAALGCEVAVAGLNKCSAQGDIRIIDILSIMGAKSSFMQDKSTNADVIKITTPKNGLLATTIDAGDIPDIVPPLAALSCYAKGTTHIVNAGRLRIKESDRLHALAVELSKLGADIKEEKDGLVITGKANLIGGSADSHNDHRIAMSIALASLGCSQKVFLSGSDCVSKSYPEFWDDWEKK